MKTLFPKNRRQQMSRPWWTVPAAFVATMLALPVNAGISIPDYPLDTGIRVAPNILFILDDSGSMAWRNMNNQDIDTITGSGGFSDGPDADGIFNGTNKTSESTGDSATYEQNYVTNTLYYNPGVPYQPWMDASGNRLTGGTSFTSAYSDNNYVNYTGVEGNTSSSTRDLSNYTQTFYVPINTSSSDNTYLSKIDNYNRYQMLTSGKVQKAEYGTIVTTTQMVKIDGANSVSGTLNDGNTVSHTVASVSAGLTLNILIDNTSSGGRSRDLDYQVYNPGGGRECDDTVSKGNNRTCTISPTVSGQYKIYLQRADSRTTDYTVSATISQTNSCDGVASGYGWINCTFTTPTGRTDANEQINFATWYSYYRTRIKTAKGGAAEAFRPLGNKVRVGFRTLHENGSANFDIPVQDGNDGRFVNGSLANGDAAATTSRSIWYNRLFKASANQGTPLQAVLNSAGQYFSNSNASGPYGPESGAAQYSCRQNFSILTTDGYWNSGTAGTGDVDSTNQSTITGAPKNKGEPNRTYTYTAQSPYKDGTSTWSSTLADVAMKYWVTDLRTDIDSMGKPGQPAGNNVPTSDDDPAFWQHMVTFGISIGLKTTLGWSNVADVGANPNWPQPGSDKAANVDDLLHAAVNSRGKFVAAISPAVFADGLRKALATIAQRTSSFSNVATNAASVRTGGKVFNASYVSGIWTGAVRAYTLDANNVPSTLAWTSSIPAFGTRKSKVFTFNGTGGTTFPTGNQTTAMDRSTVGPVDYPVTGAKNADYIMGDQSGEGTASGKLRVRDSLLGDIIDSSPAYVDDTKTLYVGANDGMLHAFDSDTGVERFAYVPNIINFGALAQLSRGDYDHKWFVDGPVVVTDRRLTTGENWLVGALGRGGKGLFGLDVSSPASFGTSNVKWELADTANGNMGLVTGRPVLAKVKTGAVAAILGNGVNSTNNKAVLLVVNAKTGAVIAEVNTNTGDSTNPNGLSAPTGIVGPDGKTIAYAYAGDRLGNVWKFDLTSATASNWTATKLFTAKAGGGSGAVQPITGGVTVATDPRTYKRWVFFGTGSYMTNSEASDKTQNAQGMYGIIDQGAAVAYSDLVARGIANTGATQDGFDVRTFDAKADLPAGKLGWYVSLPGKGERIVVDAQVVSNILVTASMIPDGNGCEGGGTGYINALDAFTGTSTGKSLFDLNNDGSTTDTVIGGVPIGSVNFGVGMPTLPIMLDGKLIVGGTNAGESPGSGGITNKTWARVSWREIRGD
ncbi:PilC/PilY family type IV pilus protein [Thermomonas sp.]|uniref:pilus assembly protein n=1 Tax=Thermomonas sp. TaxID=1971895 RepID=UPI002487C376|nr:PilC/PilY family type IV pilus protein [Thermomonas sp.]MDI1252038.1 PilC/PilY family type IV pilus protein [Thermomonas sp.]